MYDLCSYLDTVTTTKFFTAYICNKNGPESAMFNGEVLKSILSVPNL